MALGFMEPTLLALPLQSFFRQPGPDGGVRKMDARTPLKSYLQPF
jgi:hypothetical protein